jgi:tetratricopeptide (TPR) repeat protein
MSGGWRSKVGSLCVYCTIASLTGCTGIPFPSSRTPDLQQQAAERKAEITREFEQKRDHVQYQAALARFEANDTEGCRKALQQLLERSPEHYESRLLQTELMLLAGELREAKEQIEALLTERPEDAAAHHVAGLLLEAENNLQQAVTQYEQAVKFAPDNSAYRTNLQLAQEALTDLKTGGAFGITRVAADLPEPNVMDVTKDIPQRSAVRTASKTTIKHAEPDDAAITIQSATALLQSNQPAKARELLEAAKSRYSSSAPIYRTLGLACYRAGDYHAAYDALQTAVSLDNASGLSYFLMGCTLSKLGERQAAEVHFSQAAALDSRFAQTSASAL